MVNIVLCGGSGTRLWPISRTLYPKQFIQLFEGNSLFQKTVMRNRAFSNKQIFVSNTEQYFMAMDQLEELKIKNETFLLEPVGRNTAPAIALACFQLTYDDIVLVTPADHLIKKVDEYERKVREAKAIAEDGFLVTFGIEPSYPETGFGYIEADGHNVLSFREKPELETAKRYVEAGNYYWNSGMFVFKAGVYLEELQKYSPGIYESSKKAYEKAKEKSPIRISLDDMLGIPEDSIDYAVMEKSEKVKVVPVDIGWSDMGSFDALYEEFPKDQSGNSSSNDKYINIESRNNLVISDRTVATIDIQDMLIIDTPDALLLSNKGSSDKVKEVVSKLKEKDSDLSHVHVTAHRPWGTYTVLEEADRYKIKRIVVKPGAKLSLQKHFHRNEHWIVVSGTARVTVENREVVVRPNQSTYINLGEIHRLENPGRIDLVLIEVQVGEYLGEDDIVRIEDDYKREESI